MILNMLSHTLMGTVSLYGMFVIDTSQKRLFVTLQNYQQLHQIFNLLVYFQKTNFTFDLGITCVVYTVQILNFLSSI